MVIIIVIIINFERFLPFYGPFVSVSCRLVFAQLYSLC